MSLEKDVDTTRIFIVIQWHLKFLSLSRTLFCKNHVNWGHGLVVLKFFFILNNRSVNLFYKNTSLKISRAEELRTMPHCLEQREI